MFMNFQGVNNVRVLQDSVHDVIEDLPLLSVFFFLTNIFLVVEVELKIKNFRFSVTEM